MLSAGLLPGDMDSNVACLVLSACRCQNGSLVVTNSEFQVLHSFNCFFRLLQLAAKELLAALEELYSPAQSVTQVVLWLNRLLSMRCARSFASQ